MVAGSVHGRGLGAAAAFSPDSFVRARGRAGAGAGNRLHGISISGSRGSALPSVVRRPPGGGDGGDVYNLCISAPYHYPAKD